MVAYDFAGFRDVAQLSGELEYGQFAPLSVSVVGVSVLVRSLVVAMWFSWLSSSFAQKTLPRRPGGRLRYSGGSEAALSEEY